MSASQSSQSLQSIHGLGYGNACAREHPPTDPIQHMRDRLIEAKRSLASIQEREPELKREIAKLEAALKAADST